MKNRSIYAFFAFLFCVGFPMGLFAQNKTLVISTTELKDKVKGGWAGQAIGVTYGGPTEFHYKGTIIQQYQKLELEDGIFKWWYDNEPGLYDDLYMDLTFVDVIDKYGIDAPVDSFANAFTYAKYDLWHANQAGRYNIMHGIKAPQSGFWKNNPHADCIDYQIEADFAGIMSPGMPNVASEISDKVGHIMSYGDGWYGGVYVGSMYSLAYTSNNVEYVVIEALKSIPENTTFHKCISAVIASYKKDPSDWRDAWFEVQKNFSEDVGCPDGVFSAFNIDAKVNSAYIVIGLLYGERDFEKTIEISTRCGQDSDCNPASAGGILGAILGYNKLPEKWMKNLQEVEDIDFKYTTISLNKAYDMSYRHALDNIKRNQGKITDKSVTIELEPIKPVRYEQSFENIIPTTYDYYFNLADTGRSLQNDFDYSFEGAGIVIRGWVAGDIDMNPDYSAKVEVSIDGEVIEVVDLPLSFTKRRLEIFWNYDLTQSKHQLTTKWLNSKDGIDVIVSGAVVYKSTK